jgi:hypothetical protein
VGGPTAGTPSLYQLRIRYLEELINFARNISITASAQFIVIRVITAFFDFTSKISKDMRIYEKSILTRMVKALLGNGSVNTL